MGPYSRCAWAERRSRLVGSPHPTLLFRSAQEGFREVQESRSCSLGSASSAMPPPTAARAFSLNLHALKPNGVRNAVTCAYPQKACFSTAERVLGICILSMLSGTIPAKTWPPSCGTRFTVYADDPQSTIRQFSHSLIHSPVYLPNQLSIHPLACK